MTLRRAAVAATLLFLALVYVVAFLRDLTRGPRRDEVEHLHTATRMARGDRIYVDFAQHHPPLFHALLMPLVEEGRSVKAMQVYVTRARCLIAVITAIAIAAAALVMWRASGNPWTVVIFIALVFAADGVWRDGLGDIRPDAAALALWWIGAALVLLTERPALRGLGVGLVFVACLVIPKWPLMSLAIGIVLLIEIGRDVRSLLIATAVAALTAAAGLGATALLSDLRWVYFHVIEVTANLLGPQIPKSTDRVGFYAAPPLLRPLQLLLATVLVGLAWFRARTAFASPRLVAVLFVLAAASLCEIRFLYRYPMVEHRYYAAWVFAASPILALVPQSAAALLVRINESLRKPATAVMAGGVILALAATHNFPQASFLQPDRYWLWSAWMLARMEPGDTVWLERDIHPIGAADASYHWFGIPNIVPLALKASQTSHGRRFLPPMEEADLPPCRVERGLDRHLRFLSEPDEEGLPEARACFDRLVQRGVVVRTPMSDVFIVPRS